MLRTLVSNCPRLLRNERGSIAVTAALAAGGMMLILGTAVDYSRTVNARSKLQTAVDSAVLAGLENTSAGTRDTVAGKFLTSNAVTGIGLTDVTPSFQYKANKT